VLLAKLDFLDPSTEWAATYDGGVGDDLGLAVDAQSNGSLTMIGVTGYRTTATDVRQGTTFLWTDGSPTPSLRWRSTDSGGTDSRGAAINVVVGPDPANWRVYTTARVGAAGSFDWWTAHYDSATIPPSSTKDDTSHIGFSGASNGDDVPVGMTYQFLGNGHAVFVTGRSFSSVSGDDFRTIRYADTP